MLSVALPKGRIAEQTLEIFSKIFGSEFKFEDRKLIMTKGEFKFLMVRNQDIPTYITEGAADIGVVGLDVLEEHRCDVLRLLDLGLGKCRVCIGIRENQELDYTKPELKIATKMPNITKSYFDQKAIAVKIIKLYGSIELAPIVGLSDAIVDIVETGTTLKENGLTVLEEVCPLSARVVVNQVSMKMENERITKIISDLKTVI